MPSPARQDMPSQQTDHMLGLQAEHCQPGLQLCSSGDPVPSTSVTCTTNSNKNVITSIAKYQPAAPGMVQDEHDQHRGGVGGGGGVIAGPMSDTIPMCVVGQGGGRRGGGVGSVAAVCSPDSSTGASSQQSQITSQNSADRLAGSLARINTP